MTAKQAGRRNDAYMGHKVRAGQYFTVLSFNDGRLHLVQVLFDTQLLVFDHLLLLVHGFLDLLTHHLKHSSVGSVIALFIMLLFE